MLWMLDAEDVANAEEQLVGVTIWERMETRWLGSSFGRRWRRLVNNKSEAESDRASGRTEMRIIFEIFETELSWKCICSRRVSKNWLGLENSKKRHLESVPTRSLVWSSRKEGTRIYLISSYEGLANREFHGHGIQLPLTSGQCSKSSVIEVVRLQRRRRAQYGFDAMRRRAAATSIGKSTSLSEISPVLSASVWDGEASTRGHCMRVFPRCIRLMNRRAGILDVWEAIVVDGCKRDDTFWMIPIRVQMDEGVSADSLVFWDDWSDQKE